MVDRLKEIPKKILEWWNKFTTRQKTIIISIAAGVILALAILVTLLTRKTYVTLATCETTAEAAEIVDLLESNSLDYKTSTDGTIVSVLDSQESQANLLLGANKITADGYTIDDVTSGGFSTTESDKQKRWVYLLQQKMETDLESNSAVKNATVTLDLPENDGTLISQKTEAYAAITLELEGELTEENAAALARFVASALGNETTDNVTIIDTDGNLLFSGEDVSSVGGATATTQLSMKKKAEELVKNEVKSVLLGTDLYDSVEVASNLISIHLPTVRHRACSVILKRMNPNRREVPAGFRVQPAMTATMNPVMLLKIMIIPQKPSISSPRIIFRMKRSRQQMFRQG